MAKKNFNKSIAIKSFFGWHERLLSILIGIFLSLRE